MNKFDTSIAFLDLLFNLVLLFCCLFILSFVLIEEKKEEAHIKSKAEFIITLTWKPDDCPDDVDLHVLDPLGYHTFYADREPSSISFLNYDNLGHSNTYLDGPFGRIEVIGRQEIIHINKSIPGGDYVVNSHMFRKIREEPTEIQVRLDQISPFKTITIQKHTFKETGEEHTMFRFKVDQEGKVIDLNFLPKRLIFPSEGPELLGSH